MPSDFAAAEQWQLQSRDMKILITPITAFQGDQATLTHNQFNEQEIRNLQQAITPNVREIHAYWLAQRSALIRSPSTRSPFQHEQQKIG